MKIKLSLAAKKYMEKKRKPYEMWTVGALRYRLRTQPYIPKEFKESKKC